MNYSLISLSSKFPIFQFSFFPIFLLSLFPTFLLSQSLPTGPTTRAVVIGISDYQSEEISDLKYAHKDAEAFAEWLQSEAGGGLTEEQVVLLKDKNAKLGNIVSELWWLIQESKEGDRCVIYFSGHGDVERVTNQKNDYLLPYDSPHFLYQAGAMGVHVLQGIISTLSDNNVEVILITDACRAGKLAGSEIGGSQATTAALQQQFAKEVKILSCQPDEFSVEGEQWGGGRGAFSYHLVEGLYGLADQNTDMEINLMEIGNYLQQKVPAEAAPESQIPMTVGNFKTKLALVNEEILAALQAEKSKQLPRYDPVVSKGLEERVLDNLDTAITNKYYAFQEAIERKDLMEEDPVASLPGKHPADHYFNILIEEPKIARLHGLMKRNFAAALQNEAQEITNKVLTSDPETISDIWTRPYVFDYIPNYLRLAVNILGKDHFFYKYLKARAYYFLAKLALPSRYPHLLPDSVARMGVQYFEKALEYDSSAAYLYVDYGMTLWAYIGDNEKALEMGLKVIELSPNYTYGHHALAYFYRRLHKYEKAIYHNKKAIELDSNYLSPYNVLGYLGGDIGDLEMAQYYQNKHIEKGLAILKSHPEKLSIMDRSQLGLSLMNANRFEEAFAILLEADRLCNSQFQGNHEGLRDLYATFGDYEKALEYAKRFMN